MGVKKVTVELSLTVEASEEDWPYETWVRLERVIDPVCWATRPIQRALVDPVTGNRCGSLDMTVTEVLA